MKFAATINMERQSPDQDMHGVMNDATELAVAADEAGFDMVLTGEHHTIEMNICPNPLVQLASWAHVVKRARLGTAILAVPYWHPIRLAEEAAQVDHLSNGRLELGLGRGAFQYEFDRMGAGITAEQAREVTSEIVPLIKQLWQGDAERAEEPWPFPRATAVPKPLQKDLPIWISARHPSMFELAVREGCDVMANPLSAPFSEVESLIQRLDDAVAKVGTNRRPRMMILRDLCVYESPTEWQEPAEYIRDRNARFQTLFQDRSEVVNGFPVHADLEDLGNADHYSLENLHEQHLIGTPEEVAAKLKPYADLDIDYMLLRITCGLPHEMALRSLELFGEKVLPLLRAS